ncbi:hypothetical protein EUGRSUZ_C03055, partial [Eucalyptus grandis]
NPTLPLALSPLTIPLPLPPSLSTLRRRVVRYYARTLLRRRRAPRPRHPHRRRRRRRVRRRVLLRVRLLPLHRHGRVGGDPDPAPHIIFSRSSCCMCHVMRKLLASIGVNPTVIELDDDEIAAIPTAGPNPPPAVFIGGTCVGGLEALVALHLSGHLVPKLAEVGVL